MMLKYYVDPKEFGDEADHVAKILQSTFPSVAVGVGPTRFHSKPTAAPERAKMSEVAGVALKLLNQLKQRVSVEK